MRKVIIDADIGDDIDDAFALDLAMHYSKKVKVACTVNREKMIDLFMASILT